MTPEKRIENKIKAHVTASGGVCIKTHGTAISGRGLPDLWGHYAGRAFAVEVKAPGGIPRPAQVAYMRLLSDAYVVGVVDSVASFEELFNKE